MIKKRDGSSSSISSLNKILIGVVVLAGIFLIFGSKDNNSSLSGYATLDTCSDSDNTPVGRLADTGTNRYLCATDKLWGTNQILDCWDDLNSSGYFNYNLGKELNGWTCQRWGWYCGNTIGPAHGGYCCNGVIQQGACTNETITTSCINQEDVNILQNYIGDDLKYRPKLDFNKDDKIDVLDIAKISTVFGACTGDSNYDTSLDITNVPKCIDQEDLDILGRYLSQSRYRTDFDFNNDSRIDILDIASLAIKNGACAGDINYDRNLDVSELLLNRPSSPQKPLATATLLCINQEDIDILRTYFGRSSNFPSQVDLNKDGEINVLDISEISTRFGACNGDSNYNKNLDLSNITDTFDFNEYLLNIASTIYGDNLVETIGRNSVISYGRNITLKKVYPNGTIDFSVGGVYGYQVSLSAGQSKVVINIQITLLDTFYDRDNLQNSNARLRVESVTKDKLIEFITQTSQECVDSDGEDYATKGTYTFTFYDGTTQRTQSDSDGCYKDGDLYEYVCDPVTHDYDVIRVTCPNGCQDGACVNITSQQTDVVEQPSAITKRAAIQECSSGCLYNDACLPIGTRTNDGRYCSLEQDLVIQSQNDEFCNNNFECTSNICINEQCVEASLWQRFLAWFSF